MTCEICGGTPVFRIESTMGGVTTAACGHDVGQVLYRLLFEDSGQAGPLSVSRGVGS